MTKKKPPALTPAQRLQPAWVILAVELHAFAAQAYNLKHAQATRIQVMTARYLQEMNEVLR